MVYDGEGEQKWEEGSWTDMIVFILFCCTLNVCSTFCRLKTFIFIHRFVHLYQNLVYVFAASYFSFIFSTHTPVSSDNHCGVKIVCCHSYGTCMLYFDYFPFWGRFSALEFWRFLLAVHTYWKDCIPIIILWNTVLSMILEMCCSVYCYNPPGILWNNTYISCNIYLYCMN